MPEMFGPGPDRSNAANIHSCWVRMEKQTEINILLKSNKICRMVKPFK